MNVTEAIRNRRSIRKFQQGVQIPQEDLDLILEAAMMAPSARNTRPWEFVVVENREILEKFRDIQPYTGMMSVPVELSLIEAPDGLLSFFKASMACSARLS